MSKLNDDLIKLVKQNYSYTEEAIRCENCEYILIPDMGEYYCTKMLPNEKIKVFANGRCELYCKREPLLPYLKS
jgi:hypothetical protein